MRYFGGLSLEETAQALEISVMTVRRDWRAAKAWLFRRMNLEDEELRTRQDDSQSIGKWQTQIGKVVMTPERWQRVEAVLQAALDRPPAERAAFLTDVCAGDYELERETNSLVEAYDDANDFFAAPAIAQDARIIINSDGQMHPGREIGPYQIVKHIGSGGWARFIWLTIPGSTGW